MKTNDTNIEILYEDNNILVVNKPAGLVVHPDGRTREKSLVDWIKENRPEVVGIGEELVLADGAKIERPGIVHRLDRETSGALLIAKTKEAFDFFKEAFKERRVRKIYHAFVYGTFAEMDGLIDRPIGKSRSDFRKWSAERGARGQLREAVTEYEVVKQNDKFAFLHVYPRTGRTHQIRVHLKAVGRPIVSDSLYAAKYSTALGFERAALHAFSLEFENLDGKTIKVEAPYPEDFKKALELLK